MLLPIFIITCSLGITPSLSASQELTMPSAAKPGCEDRCGNVTIPFPFGIGFDCAVDKWFQIECNTSGPSPRLYLKHGNLEVLNITNFVDEDTRRPTDSIQVRNPISFYNCLAKEDRIEPLNLTGKPFYFSSSYNTFVAVSCGIVAKVYASSSDNYGIDSWCTSTCSTGNISNSLCDSIDCCEIPYPSLYGDVKISFDNRSSTASDSTSADHDYDNDECKYAFVVDSDYWSHYKNHSTGFTAIRDQGSVPVALYWQLNYSDFDIFKKNMSYTGPETTQYCDTRTPYTLQCQCNDGLRGNPYLIDGCNQGNPNQFL